MAGGRTLTLKVQTEIKGLEQLDKIGVKVSRFGRDLTTHLTLPLLAAGGAAFKFASDIQESSNKAAQVFGESIDKIDRHATSLEDILDEAAFRDVAGTFGALLQNMGLTADASADLSVRWIQLGQDMASFHNVDPTEALNAIRSALSGEFEPLKRFGVFLNEATVKQRALEQGLWDGTGAIDANTRAVIVNQELFRQQASVLGDVERTMDDAANSTRNLWANLKDTAGSLVEDLLPAATGLLKMVNGWVVGFKSLSPATKTLIVQIAGVVAVTGPLLFVFGKVLTSIKFFVGAAKLIHSAWLNIPTLLGYVDLALSKIGPAFTRAAAAGRIFSSLLLGPLGIAVAAFTAGFATDFLGMRTRFEKDMGDIGDFLGDAGDNFRDFFGIVEEELPKIPITADREFSNFEEVTQRSLLATNAIVATGVTDMATEMGEAPGKMADELLLNQFSLTDATADLVAFMEQALTPAQEMFNLQGFLASAELAEGLADNNPLIKRKAEEMREAALLALSELDKSAFNYGVTFTEEYAAGIVNALGVVKDAGRQLASTMRSQVAIESEPKDHSSPLYGHMKWGGNLVRDFADSMLRAVPDISSASAAVGRAIGFGGLSGLGALQPASVPAGMGGGTTIVNQNFYLQWDGEPPKGRNEAEIIANLQRLSPLMGGKLAAGY